MPKKGLLANLQDELEGAEEKAAARERLDANVRDLPVDVTVTLGTAQLPLAQLALQVGDVILLDQRVNQPLAAQVAGLEKIRGWPGRLGSRQAFRIEQWRS